MLYVMKIKNHIRNRRRKILAKYEKLYEENSDLEAWIKIEKTKLDYPVMYTPKDTELYRRKSFDKTYLLSGTLFIGQNCSLQPLSDNIIIYCHNMKNGSMLETLLKYSDKAFWKLHPIIKFDIIYEEDEYQVLYVFHTDVVA